MKKIIVSLITLWCYGLLYGETTAYTLEIFLTADVPNNSTGTTSFTMTAESTIWDGDFNENTMWMTENYHILSCIADNDLTFSSGFNNCLSAGGNIADTYGYGLYKLYNTDIPEDYIYLDFRDDNYGFYNFFGGYSGHEIDIWICYTPNNDDPFSISSMAGTLPFEEKGTGSTVRIWDIKYPGGTYVPSTAKFQPYAPSDVAGSVDTGNHPYLQWTYNHSDTYLTGFKIYRTADGSNPPGEQLAATTQADARSFTDSDIDFDINNLPSYRIETVNNNVVSNSVVINFAGMPTNPTGLTATKVNNHPYLTWTASTSQNGQPKYDVYRTYNSTYQRIAQNITPASYTDNTVAYDRFGDTYQYKIRAVSNDLSLLSSGYSNVVSFLGDGPIEKRTFQRDTDHIPAAFSLMPAYPNPFNPSTTIDFDIPEEAQMNMCIYDLQGHKVWEYGRSSFTPGRYSIVWNGRNLNGAAVPAGVYIIRMTASDFSQNRKVVYLK